MVKKSFLIFLATWLALVVFMPKRELYYRLEQALAQEDIKIASETIEEGWFTLTLKNPVVYVRGIRAATAESISVFTLLLYSSAQAEKIVPDAGVRAFVPGGVEEAHFAHWAVAPQRFSFVSNGEFGDTRGEVRLDERHMSVHFSENGKLGMLGAHLKKEEKGWLYETDF